MSPPEPSAARPAAVDGPSPSAQFSLRIRVRTPDRAGVLGRVTTAIGSAGGVIGGLDVVETTPESSLRDITVDTTGEQTRTEVVDALEALGDVEVVDVADRVFLMHLGGKVEQRNKHPLRHRDDLSMAYTPGVARVCQAIAADRREAFRYTIKRNTVAVVSDGTAVLGLGDIGPEAAMPVMEGKAMLFKEFAGVDAFPICLATKDTDAIVETVERIAPAFGGINLEDISAPRCFEIENRLRGLLDVPVFHDDQHGTAIVTLAALHNACRLTGRELTSLRVLIVGLGAAGVAVARILLAAGVRDVVGADSRGVVSRDRVDYQDGSMDAVKRWLAEHTNPRGLQGAPADVLDGMDLFIGLSGARVMPAAALARMAPDPMVFALANPVPEVAPEEAAPYVRIMATGRSDYPNQINNVLAFPGVFRGALDVGAREISEPMKTAAAAAIASSVSDSELREDHIVPSVFERDVAVAVAEAVARAARAEGQAVARHAGDEGDREAGS